MGSVSEAIDRIYVESRGTVVAAPGMADTSGGADMDQDRPRFVPDREALAWAAGFFDGEGCTFAAHRKQRTIRVGLSISQVEREPLERFVTATGNLAKILPRARTRKPTHRPIWTIQVTSWRNVQAIMAMLWPWLSRFKKDQYIRAVTELHADPGFFNREAGDRWPLKKVCKRGHPYDDVHVRGRTRHCRPCRRIVAKNYRARKRAEQQTSI